MGYYGGQPSEPFDGKLTTDLEIKKLVPQVILDALHQLGGPMSRISFRQSGIEVARITRTHPLSGRRLKVDDNDRVVLSINDMAWIDLDNSIGFARITKKLRVEGGIDVWVPGLGTCFIMDPDGTIRMPNLPTSDPGIAGALWNKDGKMEISAG